MKYLLVLALILSLGTPAMAQHTGETCNTTWNGGFSGHRGSGTNGAFTVDVFTTIHYDAKDPDGTRALMPLFAIQTLNQEAIDKGYSERFELAGANDTANFPIFLDIYSPDDNYTFRADVHGWGAGHLFQTSGSGEEGAAVTTVYKNIADMIANGWTCAGAI